MAVLISSIITQIDRHTGDSSLDRFSLADRYDAITEAVSYLQEDHQSEMQNYTYTLNYVDSIHYYLISNVLSDILMSSDLRRLEGENVQSFPFVDGRQMTEILSQGTNTTAYAIERHDGKAYLVINKEAKYPTIVVSQFSTLTDGGTWTLDTITSDANTLVLDTVNYSQGNSSLMFNATVAQSGNNRASIYATDINSLDFSQVRGVSSGLIEIYIPDITYFSSVTMSWGTDISNYYSSTKTTSLSGVWVNGWNTVSIPWTDTTTQVGSVNSSSINYIRIDLNYTASQVDTTGFRIDYLRFSRNEPLVLFYLSLNVGKDTSGNPISVFSAGTDTPYFSGQYDIAKYFVGHYAAGILMQDNRLLQESQEQFKMAAERLRELNLILPSARETVTQAFKPNSVNFNKHNKGRSFNNHHS